MCEPSGAFSPVMRKGRWKIYPYVLRDGRRGKMVWTSATGNAPPLRLRLGARGWHAIFVGLFSGADPSVAWIKLNTDAAPLQRGNSSGDYYGNLRDTYFKVANLSGDETIEIAAQTSGYPAACGIGFVKLIPLSEAEVAGYQADRANRSMRTMTVTDDGFSFIYARRPTTVQDMLAQLEPFRDSDVDTLILEQFGGDKVFYSPTVAGAHPGMSMDDYPEPGHRYYVETIRAFAKQRVNALKVMIDGAHAVGVKVHVAVRPAGWSWAPPYDEFWETPFYKLHPEWRCVDRDGNVTTRMSWAVPEVRRHMIDLLLEMVRFGADGANIVFVRGFPVVLYEPALAGPFRSRYGVDATTVGDTDPRMLAMRADFVTTFFSELRAELDAEQKRRANNRRILASAVILGNDYSNSWYGVDVRRLVNENLLDHIMVYPFDFGSRKDGVDYAYFRAVCDPKGVTWRVAGAYDTSRLLKYAVEAYEGGSTGVSIFDAVGRDIDDWLPLSRLGHEEETRRLAAAGASRSRYYYFHLLGDKVMDGRFSPVWGG